MERGPDGELESEHTQAGESASGSLPAIQRDVLQQLVERVGDFLLIVDEAGSITFADERIQSVLGYEPGDIVGEAVTAILAVDVDAETQLFDGESAIELPFETADGATVHTTVSTASMAAEDSTICLVRDVSDAVERAHALSRYVQLVESVGDPMYVLDERGTIELVNDAMVEYTGYPRDDLIGRAIEELVPPLDRTQLRHDPDDGSDTAETIETPLVTQSGTVILSEANITPVRDDDGTITGTVGVLRDIRDRKRRQQDLELLKQVLTRVFRHNIRNELMVIQGFTDLIESTVDDDIDAYLDEIDGAIQTLLEYGDKARKIEDVMESPGFTETTLQREIELALSPIREVYPDAQIEVEDLPDTSIQAHPKITTAIEELLDNAIRHTPESRDPTVRIWAAVEDDTVTLFIEDNAGGLEDNEISVLQQGTESDLEHSSGVGLWLVQWIVDYSDAEFVVNRTEDGTLMGIRFT